VLLGRRGGDPRERGLVEDLPLELDRPRSGGELGHRVEEARIARSLQARRLRLLRHALDMEAVELDDRHLEVAAEVRRSGLDAGAERVGLGPVELERLHPRITGRVRRAREDLLEVGAHRDEVLRPIEDDGWVGLFVRIGARRADVERGRQAPDERARGESEEESVRREARKARQKAEAHRE
jgi:hypothetical protein